MSDFARQQSEFQRGILTDDDTILAEILDSAREKRETLFGVYRYAYGSRLVEAVGKKMMDDFFKRFADEISKTA